MFRLNLFDAWFGGFRKFTFIISNWPSCVRTWMKFSFGIQLLDDCIHRRLILSSSCENFLICDYCVWSFSCFVLVFFVFCVLSEKKFGGRNSYLYPKDIKA